MQKLQVNLKSRHLMIAYHQENALTISQTNLQKTALLNLQLAHQNETLRNVINQLYRLEQLVQDDKIRNRLKTARTEAFDAVLMDDQWDLFQESFSQIHPSFFEKIKSYCKKATPNIYRFCALMKLGFDNQQIATILHMSKSSLKAKRNRLKHQMGLNPDDNLYDFIANL